MERHELEELVSALSADDLVTVYRTVKSAQEAYMDAGGPAWWSAHRMMDTIEAEMIDRGEERLLDLNLSEEEASDIYD